MSLKLSWMLISFALMAGIVAGDVEEDGLARAFERLGLM